MSGCATSKHTQASSRPCGMLQVECTAPEAPPPGRWPRPRHAPASPFASPGTYASSASSYACSPTAAPTASPAQRASCTAFTRRRRPSMCVPARASSLAAASSAELARATHASYSGSSSPGTAPSTTGRCSASRRAATAARSAAPGPPPPGRPSGRQHSDSRFPASSGGKGGCSSRCTSLSNASAPDCALLPLAPEPLPPPPVAVSARLTSAWLCRVTGSSSCSARGGMSLSAADAPAGGRDSRQGGSAGEVAQLPLRLSWMLELHSAFQP